MKFSVVIPTKNRPKDLLIAIDSLVNQTRLPNQIIIVDQSDSNESFNLINDKINFPKEIKLDYIHDTKIKGLVDAKSKSLNYVSSDIVSFFEDDVKLELDYLNEIEIFFNKYPKAMGCSGTIINATSNNFLYRFFYRITHIGIFQDPRPDIFNKLLNSNLNYIKSNVVNGGLSSWRKLIFDEFEFDTMNKFHMLEDFEFSTRVSRKYPNSLFVISKARLHHYYSPINRVNKFKRTKMKIFEYIIYFKKNKTLKYSYFHFSILLLGVFFYELINSIKFFTFKNLIYFFKGLKDGVFYKIKY